MTRLRPLKPREAERILLDNGFHFDHQTGSHRVYKHAATGRTVVVPFHPRDLPVWLIHRIARQAGLSPSLFAP